ncbi:DUF1758 domain-containing protein [Trichonephila clavipes]|nr:DUF1758 domain-containing protein [Trichonephila clavipes]
MNRCPDLVVCLKRDLQSLRPEASLVLIYRPNVVGMKGRVDLAQPVNGTQDLWHLKLADVNCLQPGPIDILLGAHVFREIMLNRHLNFPGQSLTAMESIFGWVVLGKRKLSCQELFQIMQVTMQ